MEKEKECSCNCERHTTELILLNNHNKKIHSWQTSQIQMITKTALIRSI